VKLSSVVEIVGLDWFELLFILWFLSSY